MRPTISSSPIVCLTLTSKAQNLGLFYTRRVRTDTFGSSSQRLPSKDQLVATLDTLIEGVKAGELDEHLAQQAKARGVPRP